MKNSNDIRTTKSIGKTFFVCILINSILSIIIFMIISYIGYKTRNLRVENIVILIPVLIMIFGGCTYLVLKKFFLFFGIMEQGLDKVANGNYTVTLDTNGTGIFMTMTENFNRMTKELKQTKIY